MTQNQNYSQLPPTWFTRTIGALLFGVLLLGGFLLMAHLGVWGFIVGLPMVLFSLVVPAATEKAIKQFDAERNA